MTKTKQHPTETLQEAIGIVECAWVCPECLKSNIEPGVSILREPRECQYCNQHFLVTCE